VALDTDKTSVLQADGALVISVLSKYVNIAGRSDLNEVCREFIELAMELIPCAAADLAHDVGGGSFRMAASSHPVMSERAASSGAPPLTFRLPMGSGKYGVLRFHFTDAPIDEAVRRLASTFAGQAAIALDQVALRAQVGHLMTALDTNREIAAAVGVLMARRGLGYDNAFALLRQESQRANRKLRLVASDVLHTGGLPDPTTPSGRTSAVPSLAKVSWSFSSVAVAPEVAAASQAVELGEHDDHFAAT
jgi:hypothetical protein